MAPVYSLILLATLLAGSGQRQRFPALAHASQKPADYFLPPNIYDNLPSGIQTPVAIPAAPSPTSAGTNQRPADYFLPTNIYDNLPPGLQTPAAVANALPASSTLPEPRIDDGGTKDGSISAPSGPDDPPTIKITTPLTNALYTPGSNLVMTWTNNPITFPGTWIAPQSLIGMITNDPSFSHSPLLTEGDMNNLAKMKLESMKHTQMASAMKDSPIFLSTLRLVSWPLTSSGRASMRERADTNDNSDKDDSGPFVEAGQGNFLISPEMLADPGYSLSNSSRMTILGGAGGQLTWMIPEDWEYEGEFEIRIPSVSGSNKDMKSQSFWILRDRVTRMNYPQYNLPPVDRQQHSISGARDVHQKRDMGIFLGVSAMMLAFILGGIGLMIGIYRRKWAADPAAAPSISVDESSYGADPLNATNAQSLSKAASVRPSIYRGSPYQSQSSNPFAPTQGDEDAHSPTDLSLSEETLDGTPSASEKALAGKNLHRVYSPVDSTFVDLPLYEAEDASPTLAIGSSSGRDLKEKTR